MGSFDHSRFVVDEEGVSYKQFDRNSLGRCTYHDHWHHRQHSTAAVLSKQVLRKNWLIIGFFGAEGAWKIQIHVPNGQIYWWYAIVVKTQRYESVGSRISEV